MLSSLLLLVAAILEEPHTAASTDRRAAWAQVAQSVGARSSARAAWACEDLAALVDTLVPKLLQTFNVSGMAVGVICNSSIVVSKGFGTADRERGVATTEHTLFQIASNSKLFTATVGLTLVDDGMLDLDKPVAAANPSFVFNDTYGARSLTPRDLMSHRTGLPRHDRITFGYPSRREIMEKVRWLLLDKPVRYQAEYNNLMLIAGREKLAVRPHPICAELRSLVHVWCMRRGTQAQQGPSLAREARS